MFIKQELLFTEKLSYINARDSTVYRSLAKLNLGGRCHALLIKEPLHDTDAGKKVPHRLPKLPTTTVSTNEETLSF